MFDNDFPLAIKRRNVFEYVDKCGNCIAFSSYHYKTMTMKHNNNTTFREKRTHMRWFVLFALLLMLRSADSVRAETKDAFGSLRGKVVDAVTQEPLPGASVSIVGTTFGAVADVEGHFTIANVPIGVYRVQGSFLGHQTLLKTDVVVSSGVQTELRMTLQPSAIELGEVVIQPSFFERQSGKSVSAQTFSNEEIRRAPGGLEDVIRAVSVLPGVVQASPGRNDLIVRGGAPSENLYIVDGLEVPNINHFGTQGATGGPLSFINLDFVRDVTFSTGGFGAQYGDKLSSVMNIELKDGRTDRVGGKATVSASQFGLDTQGPLGKSGSFLFSARRSYLDFIFKASGFGFVPEYWDFLGKTTHRLGPRDDLSFLIIGTLNDVRFFNETSDQRFDNSRVLGSSQDQYYSNISWRRLFKGGFVTTALGRTYTTYNYLQSDSTLRPIFQSESEEGQTSLRSDAVLLLSDQTELSFGGQIKTARLNGEMFLRPIQTDLGDSLNVSRDWDAMGFKSAAHVEISRRMTPRLRLTLGGRVDDFDRIESRTAIAPRFSASYQLTEKTTLNLSGGRYYQAPSYIWLMSNPDNRGLEYLRADQVVLGVERLLRPDTKARIEAYYKVYGDYPASLSRPYLVLSNTGAGFGGSEDGFAAFGFDPLVSEGEGVSRGAELLLQKRLSDIRCYGILSLSYTKTDFTGLDDVERPGAYDQQWIFNLSGGYLPNDKWEFSTKFRLGSGTPYTPIRSDGTRDVAAYNSERLPVFSSLDIRADRRWNFSNWNLITYIDIQNIYSREAVTGYRWNEREQKIEADEGIGILPSIGIAAEF